MPTSSTLHEWIISDHIRYPGDARPDHCIDTHRNHRGPYTGAGELVRRIISHAFALNPAHVLKHELTLLSVAPEIKGVVPVSEELARSFTFSREGNSRLWTLRLAHGLTDFFLGYVRATAQPCFVSFDKADHADATDQEFISVLLGRADPRKVALQIWSSTADLKDPLLSALRLHARISPSPSGSKRRYDTPSARRYVESECTSDDPFDRGAYSLLDPDDRRRLHFERASALGARNEPSLSLGAIPFHHEQAGGNIAFLLNASTACIRMAYYHASLDWATRGRRMLDRREHSQEYSDLTRNILFSLLLLEKYDDVEALCREHSNSNNPALLAHCAYGMAILNARLYEPSKRDYTAARTWIEKSLGFTEMLPPSSARVVNIAFLRNTLALVEMRQGRPADAVRLLTEALEYLRSEALEKYEMEGSILLHNRARVFVIIGQDDQALADYTTLLRHEPSHSEAHFDRGVIHQRHGRYTEALEDYEAAIAWSPPYAEAYFNRAQMLEALERKALALSDYDYALTLKPDFINARTNRACLLYSSGELDAAEKDVHAGLAADPDNAKLLSLKAILKMKQQRYADAYRSLHKALKLDPGLAQANRALPQILAELHRMSGESTGNEEEAHRSDVGSESS